MKFNQIVYIANNTIYSNILIFDIFFKLIYYSIYHLILHLIIFIFMNMFLFSNPLI